MAVKGRILTGDRPTGRMHLGHYVGSLANRVRLQDEYECMFIVADLHTLTTKPEREAIASIGSNVHEMVLDYLSAGIDPEKSTIFLQSGVHETYELNLIFEMMISVARLERVPSLKDMASAAHLESMPFGLLGYPVLQAADILLPRANLVPVGKDNESHIEVTREIARRFNFLYGENYAGRADRGRAVADGVGWTGEDELVARQRDLPERRREDGQREGARHVHRPEPHPRRHPRTGRGEPGVHLPRCL